MYSAIYLNIGLMLKLVDSHDLKSCGFSRPSSSLGEATKNSQRVRKTTRKSFQFVYDNVYDMINCILLTNRKGSSSASNCKSSRLKNYCYFFFYTHVLITIGNTHVFLKTQLMHLCDGLVYNRIPTVVDAHLCIDNQEKCSHYV